MLLAFFGGLATGFALRWVAARLMTGLIREARPIVAQALLANGDAHRALSRWLSEEWSGEPTLVSLRKREGRFEIEAISAPFAPASSRCR
jgi:hypothetical protein